MLPGARRGSRRTSAVRRGFFVRHLTDFGHFGENSAANASIPAFASSRVSAFDGIELPKPKQRRRSFTDDEIEKLLREGRADYLPLRCFFLLTGLRRGEFACLAVEDVVIESPAPFLKVLGKGRKRRDVPLTSAAVDIAPSLSAMPRRTTASASCRVAMVPSGFGGRRNATGSGCQRT